MIIVMKSSATESQIKQVCKKIEKLGLKSHISKGTERTLIGAIGDERVLQQDQFEAIDGVEKVMPILKPYKLVSREFRKEDMIIDVNGVKIGGKNIVVMAGPCAVESREQILETARAVKKAGASMLR